MYYAFISISIMFNPLSTGKNEKLYFWDSNNSTNFKGYLRYRTILCREVALDL